MIRHIVALRFRDDVTTNTRQALYADLAGLSNHIAGILDFKSFTNESIELPLVRGFNDLFWFDFESLDVRNAYLEDAAHQAIGARIVNETVGGTDGIFVYDVSL